MNIFQYYPPSKQRVNLSFGIEKALLDNLQESPPVTEDEFVKTVLRSYLLVYPDDVVNEAAQSILSRVLEHIEEIKKQEDPTKSKPIFNSKSLGTSYSDWLSSLDPTSLCLYLVDYDVPKALDLYWKEDFKVVQDAAKLRGQHDSQKLLAAMEASMYGFGGKYSEDHGASAENFDMGSEEAKEALKSFGF